jgi:Rieske Fe-S protein
MICGRRVALRVIGAVTLVGCSSDDASDAGDAGNEPSPCAGLGVRAGAVTDFPVGTWTLKGGVIIAQDAAGLYAFSAICTHQGCTIGAPNGSGTSTCPCHGSEFDGNGNVIVGPATAPLAHFAVHVCEGNVFVDSKKSIDPTTRTPVA